MRLFHDQLDAFAWGIGAGWLVTYLSLTHERRTIKSVRKAVVDLASYHDLTNAQRHVLDRKEWATSEDVWRVYRGVQGVLAGHPNRRRFVRRELWRWARGWVVGMPFAQDPIYIAAEVVLCTKVLGLADMHAWRTMHSIETLDDIRQDLAAVTAQIEAEV
jgi:hypothetical protein